ncbi:MAG: DUF1499 domain-containing protein [Porticoccus sp.]|nr:DUF1499 domain-containing protein [Porticoccus sp.]MBQ0808281.1 DUF1499 domain-containing protein [Porticoccus sp.]
MKIALITVFVLIALAVALLFILGKYSQKGQAPGLVNGSLSRCSTKPNCVCSEHIDDVGHYIEPVTNIENREMDKMPKVVSIIQNMNGVIQRKKDNYIAATFTSSIFGFVDDFEIRTDSNLGTLHFRSASRVGYGDGGVNRKRVELFKTFYRQEMDEAIKSPN